MKKFIWAIGFLLLIATWAWGAFIMPKLIPGPRFGVDTRLTEETAASSSDPSFLLEDGASYFLLEDGTSKILLE